MINELNKLKEYYFGSYDESQITSILRFSLFRNRFEKNIFDKNFSLEVIGKGNNKELVKLLSCIENKIDEQELKDIYIFLRMLYNNSSQSKKIANETMGEERIKRLNLSGRQLEIFNLMLNGQDSFLSLIIRVGRLRNNYFHGDKDFDSEESSKYENELFGMANHFLCLCIDAKSI